MKALELLAGLEKRELTDFEAVIKKRGRASLHALLSYLQRRRSSNKELSKSKMYKAAFGKSYSSAKDYLLRNELRLLSDALQQFLVQREFELESRKDVQLFNLWLLKSLKRRGVIRQFEQTYLQERNDESLLQRPEIAMQMSEIYFRHLRLAAPLNPEVADELFSEIERSYQSGSRAFVRYYRAAQMQQAALINELKSTGHTVPAVEFRDSIDLEDQHVNDDYSLAMYYSRLALEARGVERVSIVQRAYEHLERSHVPHIDHNRQKMSLLSFLALETFKKADLETSTRYNERFLEIANEAGLPLHGAFLFNYFNNLIARRRFREAVDLFEENRDSDRISPSRLAMFQCKVGMCYIILGDAERGLEFLEFDSVQHDAAARVTFRYIQIGASYLFNDFEGALRASRNLSKVIRLKGGQDAKSVFYLSLLRLTAAFFEVKLEVGSARTRKLKKVADQVEVFSAEHRMEALLHLSLMWLMGVSLGAGEGLKPHKLLATG